ncbi:SafA/ExsA family spore coat assembly protein [Schinkia azotoformans]|uniref:SafA/ExsA family spore coat assembly protein n=1 Tax=Schinkia azotoformans TaxID=1454 RepID=UPI002DB9F395|nr:SafA/ExsA family spore coat assembly protein [Schinkia azotoformans]MEC1721055.1 SafA/ExsA family spore coat assembly protein [Schinkia azotoformans]MED4412306.1 SafA/ExsA family spore coat assembly protein [Schinkia azotoformans]
MKGVFCLKKFIVSVLFLLMLGAGAAIGNAQTQTYTVQPGDTMWKIAVRYQIGLSELIQANPQIKNPALIYPKQKLNIPTMNGEKSIETQVIQLTNQQRAKYGLPALATDWELSRVARYKSVDMRDKNYFSHTSPTYGSPFTMMKNFGIRYTAAAENIAAGQTSPQEAVNSWMNSPGHRQNILDSRMTHIGVGYAKGGSYQHYWTQMFIKK